MTAIVLIGILLGQVPALQTQTGEISGQLLFADGTPVVGDQVLVVPVADPGQPVFTSGQRRARTDEAGGFRLRSVPPGRYYLSTGPEDLISYYPGVADADAASAVTVSAGTLVTDLEFTLPAWVAHFSLRGRVERGPNPDPEAEGQTVRLLGVGLRIQTSAIAEDGAFEFRGVQAGTYSLFVTSAPGMESVPIEVSNNIDGVVLTLPRLHAVNGTVAIEGEAARPEFRLDFDGTFRTRANVQSDGTFAARVPDGEYRLTVDRLPAGYYLRSLESGDIDLLIDPLRTTESDEPIRIDAILGTSPGVTVDGRVTLSGESTDSNLSLDRIVLTGLVVNQAVEAAVDADGSFRIARMMPGTYLARVPLSPEVSSPPIAVVVPDRDVEDLEIIVPRPIDISGSAAVAGNGPPPKFELLLVRDGEDSVSRSDLPSVPSLSAEAASALRQKANAGRTQVLTVDVDPLPDGTFSMSLPEGEYTVAIPPNGIPSAYVLASLTYGQADLRTEPLIVDGTEYAELQAGFVSVIPNPWATVSGRVVGFDPSQGFFRIALESNDTAGIETFINSDGTFQFPRVLQGTTYTAQLIPASDTVPLTRVSVAEDDVEGVEIIISGEFEVTGRVIVEGDAPTPGFVLDLVTPSRSRMSVTVEPERDGSFRIMIPADERNVRVGGLPLGYEVVSLTYGEVDLMEEPLMVTAANAVRELGLSLNVDPNVRWGAIEGHVTGLDPTEGAVRIELADVSAISTFEAIVGRDGSFQFSSIPQGTYVASLEDRAAHRSLTPGIIRVSGGEPTRAELVAGGPNSRRVQPPSPASTGAKVAELGAIGSAAANESAAIVGLRTMNTALVTYMSGNNGRYGNLSELIAAGLLDSRYNETSSGFEFSIISIGNRYAAAAVPASSGNGRYGFYSTPDGVIRYSTIETLAPAAQGGRAVQ